LIILLYDKKLKNFKGAMFKFKLPTINCLLLLRFLIFNKVTSTEYVVGKLFGQLGNQMFQIAAATSLAIDHGAIATFPDLDLWSSPLLNRTIC